MPTLPATQAQKTTRRKKALSSEPTVNAATGAGLLRKEEAGKWLQEQRRNSGLSQKDLANKIGLKYHTFISQVENGFGRVPSSSMGKWARALGISPALFARHLLAYYDPELYRVLFEEDSL
jgi:ribosome-binding protein aMBF1 (putative translation factor)